MIANEARLDDAPVVGRNEELEFLDRVASAALPSITFVNGIGGIGKSRVLDAFAHRRRAAGATVLRIDGQLVEPTEGGFLRELSRAAGGEIASCDDASWRLAQLGNVVLILDDVDVLRLLDTWLRRVFVPALPVNSGIPPRPRITGKVGILKCQQRADQVFVCLGGPN